MALADWLVDQGARHLVLTSKRGVRNGSQHLHLQDIFDKGANVSPVIDCSAKEIINTLSHSLAAFLLEPPG